jgi:uncharacterized protein (DUF433 family)
MKPDIQIVDKGRGPQLSTSRITVQDLLPYFQEGCSYDEIRRWIPVLTAEEIQVVEQYIRTHYDEVMETERRIQERNALRKNSPEVEKILRQGRAERETLRERLERAKANGGAS